MNGTSIKMSVFLRYIAALAVGSTLIGCAPSAHDLAGRGALEALEAQLQASPDKAQGRNRHDKTPLHFAASYEQVEAMALLKEHGADLNAHDTTGMTPLHAAAMFGRLEAVRWLVEEGADPMARDHFGDTALHTAAIFGAGNVIQYLLSQGLPLDDKNESGHTALDLARKYHQERVVAYLERRQASQA